MNNFEIYTSVQEWRNAVESQTMNGLFTSPEGVLMLDRRSKDYALYGPRTADLNLIGSELMIVPGEVAFSYIQEALRLRRLVSTPMGIH